MNSMLIVLAVVGICVATPLSELLMNEIKRELLLKVLERGSDYQQQPPYTQPPQYPEQPNYTPAPVYPQQPNYTPAPVYPQQPNYTPAPVYPQPKPSYKDNAFCTENGNVYTPVNGCRSFDQRVGYQPPAYPEATHHCPDYLLFDTKICVCNFPDKVYCAV